MDSYRTHIAVLDQDGSLAAQARRRLPNITYMVTGISDPYLAMDMCRNNPPDILLIQADNGSRMHVEACRSIRAMRGLEALPIMLVRDSQDGGELAEEPDADVSAVLDAPVDWTILQRWVQDLIRANRVAEELKGSEFRLYHAQKAARMGTWEYVKKDKTFILSKNAFQVFGIGYTTEPVSRDHFLDVFHPADKEEFTRLFHQATTRHFPFTLEHRILRFDGDVRFINHQVSFVRNEAVGIKAIFGAAQDVTEQKLAEYLEVDKNSVLQMIINNLPLTDVLGEVAKVVDRQRPNASTMICLASNNRLMPVVSSRLPASFIQKFRGLEIGPKAGGATAAYVGETVTASDIQSNPLWEEFRDWAGQYGLQACFSEPILSGKGQILGVILVFYKETCQPKEEDLSLLKAITDLASVAIEKARMTENLVHQARHDALTGLANRNALREWLEISVLSAKRYNEIMAILFIDLDRFKQVNDSLGHETGDKLLKEVVRRLSRIVRESDILARMGGDEFVLAAGRIEHKEHAVKLADRILGLSRKPYLVDGHELYIDTSIGMSFFPDDTTDPEVLIRNADTAMYYAKNRGGNRLAEFEPEMKMAVIERLEIENDLRKGIERKEFELFYQPQYELANRRLTGFEALIRWNHPDLGRIPPMKFIPLAEETGLIAPIGSWVLFEAAQQHVRWLKDGYGPFKVAVNISSAQLAEEGFLTILENALQESGMDPKFLEIELTESILVSDVQSVAKILNEVKSLGVSTAIDDFGTGYSSMSYLHKLPIDCLKIDRQFIVNTDGPSFNARRKRSLLRKVVEMAHSLGLTVIAEGFEDEMQFKYLLKIGCDIGQGYYLGVPMSAREIEFYCSMDSTCLSLDE